MLPPRRVDSISPLSLAGQAHFSRCSSGTMPHNIVRAALVSELACRSRQVRSGDSQRCVGTPGVGSVRVELDQALVALGAAVSAEVLVPVSRRSANRLFTSAGTPTLRAADKYRRH